jgi:hypothetical protein
MNNFLETLGHDKKLLRNENKSISGAFLASMNNTNF